MKELFILFAQKIDIDKTGIEDIGADEVLANGLGLVYLIAGFVSVAVIILAGIRYTTSTGNADGIKKAQNMLMYGIVGLIIVAVAFVITRFVIGVF